jgi:hypothetical protein
MECENAPSYLQCDSHTERKISHQGRDPCGKLGSCSSKDFPSFFQTFVYAKRTTIDQRQGMDNELVDVDVLRVELSLWLEEQRKTTVEKLPSNPSSEKSSEEKEEQQEKVKSKKQIPLKRNAIQKVSVLRVLCKFVFLTLSRHQGRKRREDGQG